MKKLILAFIFLAIFIAGPAHALQFGFTHITNNNAGDVTIGETQLFVDVTDAGSDQILFTFSNFGPADSAITKTHFDDDASVFNTNGIAAIIDGDPGVDFSIGTNPAQLPGGGSITPAFGEVIPPGSDIKTLANFWAGSQGSPPGVDPGESLGILFDLEDDFDSVINALNSGNLRIGIHVQAFTSGGSESFVNNGPTPNPIPEPATMLLLGCGLVGLAGFGRKKFFKKP